MFNSELVLNYDYHTNNKTKELESVLTYPEDYYTNYQKYEDNCDFNLKNKRIKGMKDKYNIMVNELIVLEKTLNDIIKQKEENNSIIFYINNLNIQKNMIIQNMKVLEKILFSL